VVIYVPISFFLVLFFRPRVLPVYVYRSCICMRIFIHYIWYFTRIGYDRIFLTSDVPARRCYCFARKKFHSANTLNKSSNVSCRFISFCREKKKIKVSFRYSITREQFSNYKTLSARTADEEMNNRRHPAVMYAVYHYKRLLFSISSAVQT
jgi:hypothetical protein